MRRFTNNKGRIAKLGFSPEGTTLLGVSRGAMTMPLWELPSGKFRRWHPYIDDAVSTFGYSPDGRWLVVGGVIGMALPYIRKKDGYDSEMHARKQIGCVAFSSRVVPGRTVAAIGADRVRLYDLDAPYTAKGMLWDAELPAGDSWFSAVAFHPTEDWIVGCDPYPRMLRVWDTKTRTEIRVVERERTPWDMAFTLDGKRLMVGYGQRAELLDTQTWETVAVCEHARGGLITGVAASPCGRWLATSSTDYTVRFWHPVTGEAGPVFDWGIKAVAALAFAPDGLTCAAGGNNGQVVIWDVD